MKRINFIITVLAVGLVTAQTHTGLFKWAACGNEVKTYKWNAPATDSKATKIGFSFYNKSGKPAFVSASNISIGAQDWMSKAGRWFTGETEVYQIAPENILDLELDTSKQTKLTIYDCTNLDTCKPTSGNTKAEYTFKPGKTMYVTWQADQLRPQTGQFKGWSQATAKCYNLSGDTNVKDADIIKSR